MKHLDRCGSWWFMNPLMTPTKTIQKKILLVSLRHQDLDHNILALIWHLNLNGRLVSNLFSTAAAVLSNLFSKCRVLFSYRFISESCFISSPLCTRCEQRSKHLNSPKVPSLIWYYWNQDLINRWQEKGFQNTFCSQLCTWGDLEAREGHWLYFAAGAAQ